MLETFIRQMTKIKHVFKIEELKKNINYIFYTILTVGIILSAILFVITWGRSLDEMLMPDRNDYFMDYFNSIYYSLNDPYFEYRVIYPALATAIYGAIGIILEVIYGSFATSFDIRGSALGMASYLLITCVALFMLYSYLSKSRSVSRKETILFFILILTSFPMLWSIDRGNSLLMAVILSSLFLAGYNSESKKIRYLSYISLGIATGIKIFPFLFGALLLRKFIKSKKVEDLKELIICIFIGAIIFLVPFIFFEGSLIQIIGNAFGFKGAVSPLGAGDISSLIQTTAYLLGYEGYLTLATAGTIVSLVFMLLTVLYVLFYNNAKKWELICVLAAAQVLCAGISYPYVLLYMLIPAWYFINSNPTMLNRNLIFAVLLAGILISLPIVGYEMLAYYKGIMAWAIVIIILGSAAAGVLNRDDAGEESAKENLRM